MYKVAALQIHSLPKETEKNTEQAVKMTRQAAEKGADLIVLPELWSSGYYLSFEEFKDLGETIEGKIVTTFQKLARELKTVLIVPFPEKEGNHLYISSAIIEKTGELIGTFRKSFLWGREQEIFTPGDRVYNVFDTSLGKIGVLICYDIEFPEPSRLLALQGAELIIVPSVWSIPAETRWDIQLPARALDNTVYVLGVNTVGEGSCGKTKLAAPDGKILCEAPRDEQFILLHDIDPEVLSEVRSAIPYLSEYDKVLWPGGNQ
ncbi:nitrilase-related carbon-nitrogen hydrolase [Scopulibacillus cellulosilyticus]|uniref:Nitrilase-related carbon-nitrogen hydrolase n=1 Tax=Scopulibacillus cellulosilyticus TaxID=2665665 RepID=A0ABW2PRT3_9BACL